MDFYNIEWLVANSQRLYPLAQDATARDTTGAFTLPTSFLVELFLPIHAGLAVAPALFYLARLTITPSGYLIGVGYDDGSPAPPLVAVAQFDRADHGENAVYALVGQGDLADTIGTVTIGTLEGIDAQPPGAYAFDPAGGRLDVDCIRPMVGGVSSLSVANGGDPSVPITGDLVLVSGANVQFSAVATSTGGMVRIDAIDPAGLNAPDPCAADAAPPPPIRTINQVAPTPGGDFLLQAGTCTEIRPIAHGLQLVDTCSSPCCGSAELDAVMAELQHLADQVPALRGLIDRLAGEVTNLGQNVLGARLNDTGGCPG